jgi:hypothetical protein
MELTKFSVKQFYDLAEYWRVDREYSEPMFNYLVHGFSPGSFFTYVLCNDCINAILSSHPANEIQNLKYLMKWMVNCMPREAFGDSDRVQKWLAMDSKDRRRILEEKGLILSPKEETWLALNERSKEYI